MTSTEESFDFLDSAVDELIQNNPSDTPATHLHCELRMTFAKLRRIIKWREKLIFAHSSKHHI